jgi:hypothetical protein
MMHVAQEFVLSSEQYKPCVAFYVLSRRLVGSRKKAVEHLSGASCVTLASLFCCAFAPVTLSFPAPKQAFTSSASSDTRKRHNHPFQTRAKSEPSALLPHTALSA